MALRISRILTVTLIAVILALVVGCAKPKVQVQVSRDRLQQGEDVRVTWQSKDAKQVTLNGQQVDKVGSKVYTPDNTTTFTAVAKRGSKEARDSKVVEVSARPAAPTVRISLDQDAITRGQSTTLHWNSNNADRVAISELGTVPSTGSRVVSPSQSTTYTATATGVGGTDTASARLTVTEEPPSDSRPRTNPVNTSPAIATLFGQQVQAIFFDYDSADIKPESQDRLRRAAAWLTQSPFRSVAFRIEGNCDPRGTEEYNIGLGERRAQAAKEFLVSLGVDASRIQTVSYGEERASGGSEGSPSSVPSWAHDRRDDFIYVSGGTPPRNP
ncbi:MAG TPA: OmpA family protein [Blastocatellia bacterium]|nr:OmpA family protein [Blastocatellia bacterium]